MFTLKKYPATDTCWVRRFLRHCPMAKKIYDEALLGKTVVSSVAWRRASGAARAVSIWARPPCVARSSDQRRPWPTDRRPAATRPSPCRADHSCVRTPTKRLRFMRSWPRISSPGSLPPNRFLARHPRSGHLLFARLLHTRLRGRHAQHRRRIDQPPCHARSAFPARRATTCVCAQWLLRRRRPLAEENPRPACRPDRSCLPCVLLVPRAYALARRARIQCAVLG